MDIGIEDSARLLEQVSRSWIARYRAESQSTDWGQSLAMYGLLSGLRSHYDEKIHDYLRTWIRFHMNERLYVNYFCGSWSFALLYPDVMEFFPEVRLQLDETAERIYNFIMHKALRNGEGAILHNVDLPNIYIDTVYYSSVLLAKLGTYLNQPWQDEAMKQIELHLTVLRDGTKPFYIHCEENLSGLRSQGSWARGNGWVMMTCAEIIPLLSEGSEHRMRLQKIFVTLSSAVMELQTTNGLWPTILDDESAYEETSASAMYLFALSRGRRIGVLDKSFDPGIAKAKLALSRMVDTDGKFVGASEGTWPGTVEYYKSLGRGEWWWGTGSYLLALSEQMKK
jgi:unsaturated rhamnogalacturonyl hydrolase